MDDRSCLLWPPAMTAANTILLFQAGVYDTLRQFASEHELVLCTAELVANNGENLLQQEIAT